MSKSAAALPYRPQQYPPSSTQTYLREFTRLHDDIQPSQRQSPLAIGAPPSPTSPTSSVGSPGAAKGGGMSMAQIAAPPPIQGPGPVVCDDSSGDDDELGIVKVKFGAEDQGPLGIDFKEVSIKSCNPSGMGQFRAGRPLEAGMILRAINGVPADRLAFNAVLELVGHHGGDIRGLTLTFQKPDHVNMESFNPDSPEVRGDQQALIDEMSANIQSLREQIDEKDAEIESLKHERDEQETTVIEALAPLLPRGRAKHDYPANPDDFQEGDLRFASGNKIVLLDLSDEEWARGYVENKPESVGDFPRAYIDIVGNVAGVGSTQEAVNEETEQLRAEVDKLRAIADSDVDQGMQDVLDKKAKEIAKLKKTLAAADKGDVAEAMTDAEEAARKDKKMVAKLKKRVLKDQKVLKRQHEDMEILIDEMRNWKRELQMILSDFAHMEAMFGRMQDEFDTTIPRATEMIVDKIIESGAGGGGGINEEEVDALVAERVDDIIAEKDEIIQEWIEKHNKECVERRKWFNILQEMKGNIRVFCRCRPLVPIETERGEQIVCRFDVEGEIVVGNSARPADNKLFEFDSVFGPDSEQEDIFEDTRQLVQSTMDGYNVCVFAYGQTGAGKTYTMEGDLEKNPGINLRALQELFRLRDERDGHYTVVMSQVEVYCEMVRDLLAPSSRVGQSMELKSVGDGAYVPGLTTLEVNTVEDVVEILKRAKENRAVTATKMNSESSRGHSLVTIEVSGESPTLGRIRGKLNLVDLAGSERISKSGAAGQALKEASAINSSLTALGTVINTLGKTKGKKGRGHVPYRDSKLTYLLADSLGGDAKVLMFVNVSPAERNIPETCNSLQFASRCRATELGEAKQNRG